MLPSRRGGINRARRQGRICFAAHQLFFFALGSVAAGRPVPAGIRIMNTDEFPSDPFRAQVATSVSEWKRIHSLTLVATRQPSQSQLRPSDPKPMKTRSRLFSLLLLLPLASAAAVDPAQLKAELVKMEHDFCTMASAQGVPAAFAHFAAPDAAFFARGNLRSTPERPTGRSRPRRRQLARIRNLNPQPCRRKPRIESDF